jgi:molecular chaperone DnaK (HSP70)
MKIEAKNGLDGYLFQMKDSIKDLPTDVKKELEEKMNEAQELVDGPIVNKEDYDTKRKEIQDLYENAMKSSNPSTSENEPNEKYEAPNYEPKIEEVD